MSSSRFEDPMRMTRLEAMRRRYGVVRDGNNEGIPMMFETTARVPTQNGSRYLQQLCKHWSHNLNVEFTPEAGKVIFPKNVRGADWPGDATLTLKAEQDTLECHLEASAEAQRETLKGVVSGHLDRFAFREAPLKFDWRDA
jgi:uncharacterized protein